MSSGAAYFLCLTEPGDDKHKKPKRKDRQKQEKKQGANPSITTLDFSGTNIKTLQTINWKLYPRLIALNVSGTDLVSLEGCPKTLLTLNASDTDLISLKGCPASLTSLDVSETKITSLEFCPQGLNFLDFSETKVNSFKYCPPNLQVIKCVDNKFQDLKDAPDNTIRVIRDAYKQLIKRGKSYGAMPFCFTKTLKDKYKSMCKYCGHCSECSDCDDCDELQTENNCFLMVLEKEMKIRNRVRCVIALKQVKVNNEFYDRIPFDLIKLITMFV